MKLNILIGALLTVAVVVSVVFIAALLLTAIYATA